MPKLDDEHLGPLLDAMFLSCARSQYKRYDLEYVREEAVIRDMIESSHAEHASMPDNYWKNRHRLYNLRHACAMIIAALETDKTKLIQPSDDVTDMEAK